MAVVDDTRRREEALKGAFPYRLRDFNGFELLDLAGSFETFQQANRLSGGYSCEIISVSPGPVRSDSGLQVNAGHGVRDCAPCGIDILVVAGGTGVDTARDDAALAGWIAAAAAGARRVTSVCSAACSCSRRRA